MTAYIPLNGTEFAVVDLEDVPRIFEVSLHWHKNEKGYAIYKRKVNGRYCGSFHIHRIVAKTPSGIDTDHINRNPLDNQKHNLRLATNSQNQANKRKVKTWGKRPSHLKGLSSKGKGWRVYCNGQYLGYEKDEALAALMYNAAAFNLWGSYSLLNELIFDGMTGKRLEL